MSPAEKRSPCSRNASNTFTDGLSHGKTSDWIRTKPSLKKRNLAFAWSTALFLGSTTQLPALLPQEQPGQISMERNPSNNLLTASWRGEFGKTYFLQKSEDLIHWEYSPTIRSGGSQLSKEVVDTEGAKQYFFRLRYIDETATNPDLADFDHDGVANIVELQQGTDPFNPCSGGDGIPDSGGETSQVRMSMAAAQDQLLTNGQVLGGTPTGSATVVLGGNTKGEILSGMLSWSSGGYGSNRGLISQPLPASTGRSVIVGLMTDGLGDISTNVGFTSSKNLGGLITAGGFSLIAQRTADGRYNRLVSCVGSNFAWVEMSKSIDANTPYRMLVRREVDGYSSWIQGGMYSSTGAIPGSASWFPISRWKSANPAGDIQAGLNNTWVGPTITNEFSDSTNPTIDSTSALLDYERNKIGIHVPSLLKIRGGRVLAVWQNSGNHETNDSYLKMAIRDSRGTWGPSFKILGPEEEGVSYNGPVLHQVGDKIWLTHQAVSGTTYTAKRREMTITGNTVTLLEPVTLFNTGLILNHILTLPTGRMVACWHTQASVWKNRISYSDDAGLTWTPATFPQFNNRAGEGFAAIEADGTLSSYWRTDLGSVYRSVSADDGESWSALVPTAIPCPNMPSQGLLGSRVAGYKRPSDGKLVIVGSNSKTQREKLTAWLVENGEIVGIQSLLPWDVLDGSAEGLHYPDIVVNPDDSMTIVFARWMGGGIGSAEVHSAINTFQVGAAFQTP